MKEAAGISIFCDNRAINNPDIGQGMIYLDVGSGSDSRHFYSLGLERGDKVYFRGSARRWKWKKYIDSKKAYISPSTLLINIVT